MDLNQLAIGIKLEIDPIFEDKDKIIEKKKYTSQLLDIVDDDLIKISMPMHKGKIVMLSTSFAYDLYFYTKKGIFKCQANIIDRYKSNNMLIWVMELTSPLIKYQRREYFRLECLIDMKYLSIEPEVTESSNVWFMLDNAENKIEGVFVDISGGGGRFVSKDNLESGSFIILACYLNNTKFTLLAHIIASTKVENKPGQYESRCKFIKISKSDREAIIRFIFEQDRRNRKKK